MLRYVEENDRIFDDVFHRGRQLSDDPLQAFLITLKLLAELMADLPNGHPGCLIATFTYQERLFDRDVRDIASGAVRSWNQRFRDAFNEIARVYPPREGVAIEDVANMFSCVVDGGIIMARGLGDPRVLERQILAFRSFVKMLFQPAAPHGKLPDPTVVAADVRQVPTLCRRAAVPTCNSGATVTAAMAAGVSNCNPRSSE